MNGQQLYRYYQIACLKQNCGTDNWEELDDNTRMDWNELAVMLNERGLQ